uniref:Uncharacterized protein n=1 Tax=Sphaerodactylus townsendi TaxID=933632 RepID=A0ACB8EQX5_9SAUR
MANLLARPAVPSELPHGNFGSCSGRRRSTLAVTNAPAAPGDHVPRGPLWQSRRRLRRSEMLKPGDPGGSAFLKVDPAYLQHWQQLFPHSSQLKGGAGLLGHLQVPDRPVDPPADSLRQLPAPLSSASSSSSSSSSSTPSSAASSCAAASLVSLTSLPVAQIPVFGPIQSSESPVGAPVALLPTKDPAGAGAGSGGAKGPDRVATRLRCTAEELDYYLYGQQRMEIIPLNQHTGDPNNRTYRFSALSLRRGRALKLGEAGKRKCGTGTSWRCLERPVL